MFSGIVKEVGTVTALRSPGADHAELEIQASMFADREAPPAVGDSILVSGVCLTVVRIEDMSACFDAGSETLRKTTLGSLASGSRVNLERSLRVGDRIDGHFVQGHVDCVATVRAAAEEAQTLRLEITLTRELRKFIAPKGSVAVDGVSLTIGEVEQDWFSVYIIPLTRTQTTVQYYRPGTSVNVEADCLARYVVQALQSS